MLITYFFYSSNKKIFFFQNSPTIFFKVISRDMILLFHRLYLVLSFHTIEEILFFIEHAHDFEKRTTRTLIENRFILDAKITSPHI
jgi:hypothetical protein